MLSMFVIAAALILVALLFRLGLERRANQIGLMLSAESPQPVQPTTPAQPAPEEHPKASDWEEF